jgi:hypothetical protein
LQEKLGKVPFYCGFAQKCCNQLQLRIDVSKFCGFAYQIIAKLILPEFKVLM